MVTGELVGTAFAEALAKMPPPPCEKCALSQMCATQEMACWRFAKYVGVYRVPKGEVSRRAYAMCYPKFASIEEEDAAMKALRGRPRGAKKKQLAETQKCSVCGKEKPRKAGFPRSSTRCYACRPKRAQQVAQWARDFRARQMAILMGEESA